MKELCYIANVRMPTEKAHGIQIMNMCAAFAAEKTSLELIVPSRRTHSGSPFSYYGLPETFTVTKLWCVDSVHLGRLGFWFESFTFGVRMLWYTRKKKCTFYTRDEFFAFLLHLSGKVVIWEAHMGQKNIFARFLVHRVKIVVISQGLKDLYVRLGAPQERVLVAHDGVDLARFSLSTSKEAAREKLGLPKVGKLALYTGSRYAWKGVDTLQRAEEALPEVRVKIVSDRPHKEIPFYLRAADVLVLPNSAREDISRAFTSPMKLFEYMASGTPIVASDVPAIREVLNENTCFFFIPDDANSLAAAILQALKDPLSTERAMQARRQVEHYTWGKRAQAILSLIHV